MKFLLLPAALIALAGAPALAQPWPSTPPPPPVTPTLEFAFEAIVMIGSGTTLGQTQSGRRSFVPITGGTFQGPQIKGTVLAGGWDWQLKRADGCGQFVADYMLKTDDGTVININNGGVNCPTADGKPKPGRSVLRFEAPVGKHDWLNRSNFVGTLDLPWWPDDKRGAAVRIRVYRVV